MTHSKLVIIVGIMLAVTVSLTYQAEGAEAKDQYQQQADAYWEQAKQLVKDGKNLEAAQRYEQCAVTEQRSAAPRLSDVASAWNQAGYYYNLGEQPEKALSAYQESLRIFRELHKESSSAIVLNNLGSLYTDRREYALALDHYQQAITIARELEKEDALALALANSAKVYNLQGEYDRAIDLYQQALALQQKLSKDAAAAVSLNNIGLIYKERGDYANALTYYQQALAINQQLHKEGEAALNLNNIGTVFEAQGDFAQALAHYQQALTVYRSSGLDNRQIVTLNNIGLIYKAQNEYSQALAVYQEALELARKGNRETEAAAVLNNMGAVHQDTGAYESALQHYEQALSIYRNSGLDHKIGAMLNNIGEVYRLRGRYAEAVAQYQQALEIAQQAERVSDVGFCLNNLSVAYNEWGRYAQALQYGEQALEIARSLGEQANIRARLSNIGSIYEHWGSYDTALTFYQDALELAKMIEQPGALAIALNKIGFIYSKKGQFDNALEHYQQALKIVEEHGMPENAGVYLNNLAHVYQVAKQYQQALEHYQRSLAIARQIGREGDISIRLNNIGSLYAAQAHYEEALTYYRQAWELDQKLGRKPEIAIELSNIGLIYYRQEHYRDAIVYFEQAVALKEELRKTATGVIRRDYLASQMGTYQYLSSCYVRIGDFAKAFEMIELSRAKLLTEQLAGADDIPIPPLDRIQQQIPDDTAVIIYANTNQENLIRLVVTRDQVDASERSISEWLQQVTSAGSAHGEIRVPTPRGLNLDEQSSTTDLTERLPSSLSFAALIETYRAQLQQPTPSRGLNVDTPEPPHTDRGQLSGSPPNLGTALYEFLFDHLHPYIQGKSRLLIAPEGVLTLFPFETLCSAQGTFLIEQYDVSYIQSLSVLELIASRQYPAARKPLLAFGGAVYDASTYAEDIADNEAELAYLYTQVESALNQGKPVGTLYAQLRSAAWGNLPGTLDEVNAIRRVITDSEVITGQDVNETTVKTLNAKGALADYKVLHFATHGDADANIPELSALVLSLPPETSENETPAQHAEDGYLRAGEVQHLTLNADFVNLSACETGLGKLYPGEGMVGLTHAFLIAGANGVSVSLWQVADQSTAQFMVALYSLVQQYGLTYAQANIEVKRRFLRGAFGEAWQAPYFWAPFVYYGK